MTNYAYFCKSLSFAVTEPKRYYRTRRKLNILLFVTRPRPANQRFYTMKIDFFHSDKK